MRMIEMSEKGQIGAVDTLNRISETVCFLREAIGTCPDGLSDKARVGLAWILLGVEDAVDAVEKRIRAKDDGKDEGQRLGQAPNY